MEEIANVQNSMPDNLLIDDTCRIIESARDYAYRAVNTALTIRNWKLGERISREHLDDNGRAEYGKQVIATLATILTDKYGKGFDFSSLYQYVKFYHCFPGILDAVSPKSGNVDAVSPKLLPWTLYRELIRVEDGVARKWYEQEALRETWSSRTLHRNIGSQYYYRLMQSPTKDKVAKEMHQATAPLQDKLEFIKMAFTRGYVPEGGLELNSIMPPINPFDPDANRKGKVEHVLDRIKSFFTKYFGFANGKFTD